MEIMELLFGMILFTLIVLFVITGIAALRHIDDRKLGSFRKADLYLMGPMIPEKVLTDQGRRWTTARNWIALFLFGGAVIFGSILSLNQ